MAQVEEETRAAAPVLPWKARLLIAGHTFAVDYSRRSNGTVNRRLMDFLDPKAPPSSDKPINGVTSSDITVNPSRNLWFRLYTPNEQYSTKLPVVVYFHGGGFVFFSASTKTFDDFCRRLAVSLPAVVVSVNYRLAPEHRFPSQFDDGLDTLKFLDEDEAVLPPIADLSRCFIAGDSAGGNIAHHVTLRAVGAAAATATTEQDLKKVKIKGVIAVQPFFGGEERTESELRLTNVPFVNTERSDWMWRAFLPQGSDRNHEAANVALKSANDMSTFPATMVVVGGFDPLQDWQKRYVEWLKKEAGKEAYLVEYPNAIHGFYGFPEFPEASLLITDVRDFIHKQH